MGTPVAILQHVPTLMEGSIVTAQQEQLLDRMEGPAMVYTLIC